jgi:hypothetical protein
METRSTTARVLKINYSFFEFFIECILFLMGEWQPIEESRKSSANYITDGIIQTRESMEYL